MPLTLDDQSIAIVDLTDSTKQVGLASGSVPVSGQLGFIAVGITPNGTASFISLDQSSNLKVTGSITVPNTVLITGSVGVNGLAFASGSLAVFISGSNPLTLTGSSVLVTSTSFDATPGGSAPAKVAVIGGLSGSTIKTININTSGSVYVNEEEEPTFVATANNIALANNKSMLALFNSGSTNTVIKIREILIKNTQLSSITGINAIFEFFRFTGITGGTAVTPLTYDTIDSLATNITSSTGGTITGEAANSFMRVIWNSDEQGDDKPAFMTTVQQGIQNVNPSWKRHDIKEKPITLRSSQGLHIKHTVNSTAGTFDISIIFTQVT